MICLVDADAVHCDLCGARGPVVVRGNERDVPRIEEVAIDVGYVKIDDKYICPSCKAKVL